MTLRRVGAYSFASLLDGGDILEKSVARLAIVQ
jgi:hypothetical protein